MDIEKIEIDLKDKRLEITYDEKIGEKLKTKSTNYDNIDKLAVELCVLLKTEVDKFHSLETHN